MQTRLNLSSPALYLLALVALVLPGQPARADEWGSLVGRFIYDGPVPQPVKINANRDPEVCGKHELRDESLEVAADGGLHNAVVFLRTEGVPVAPSYAGSAAADVILDCNGCRFAPHIVLLRTTQTLVLKNSDPIAHNAKFDPLRNPAFNPIIRPGQSLKQSFPVEETLPMHLSANIHPWMGGWLLVRQTPYMAVSDHEGNFEIKDLPVGEDLEFRLWQERAGYLKDAKIDGAAVGTKGRFTIKLRPGENKLGDIKVSPDSFR